jgi:hypothetical protein
MEDKEFESLISACSEIGELFPEGLVFIGGIAVYLHAINHDRTRQYAESTHDADFYISIADMADLRDLEEVTSNRRLSKHQMVKKGFEFDIYTERLSALVVPYDVIAAHAIRYGGIRVAALEHLMVLKLEAFLDRKGSAKGEKDAKDLLRIGAVADERDQGFRPDLALPYLRDEHLELLEVVERGPYAASLSRGNAVEAKRLRGCFSTIAKGFVDRHGPRNPRRFGR